MPVRVLTKEEEFSALQSTWQELFDSNPNNSPFQSWDWNFTWWKHFGTPGALRLVLVEEDGRIIGIAPLFVARRFRGLPLAHLAFISHKRTDYLDFIVRPGNEADFFRQLFEFLVSGPPEWLFIELKDFSERSTNLLPLLRESARAFPALSLESAQLCVTLELTRSWDEFVATLGKRMRKDVGYDRRYLAKHLAVDFRILESARTDSAALDDLITIYRGRWQAKEATQFDDGVSARFEREIALRFSEAGWYRLYLLYADQKPAAGLLGYVLRDKFYADVFAHSPSYEKYSVGNVLLGMAIEDCIANHWTELDLSRGDEAYKYRWNGQTKRNYCLRIFRSRAGLALASFVEWIYQRGSSVALLQGLLARYRRLRSPPQSATSGAGGS
jgi:CelD/BcsL family acetyltransferase involved in cellulose biosynthesis